MKKRLILFVSVMAILLCACGGRNMVDYGSAESFEAALCAGEDLTGAIVTFKVDSLHPESFFGYDLWAGEHLNFVSESHPGVKAGETITVRATKINSTMGSWIIYYEKVKAKPGNDTVY